MGTELGFNDFSTRSLRNLFHWQDAGDEIVRDGGHVANVASSGESSDIEVEGAAHAAEAIPEAAPDPYEAFPELVFPASMKVAGFLHIGHNALARVCKSLPSWESTRNSSQQFSALFSRSGSCTVFSRHLLVGEFEQERPRFEKDRACPEFIEWRWAT